MATSFKIIEKKNLWFLLSAIIICIGLSLMFIRAAKSEPVLNFGIDFSGGSTMILKFDALTKQYQKEQTKQKIADINIQFIEKVRAVLKAYGLEKSSIQITSDQEVIIKTIMLTNQQNIELRETLEKNISSYEILEIDFIGPTIGQELRKKSLWIIFIVTLALLLYITWRFEFIFGLAALIALIHDALITISFASFLNIEISTVFVAALLTILGYSINDTIVIFDRIRENIKLFHKKQINLINIANISLNQTLARTINTSLTTILVITCLLLFGGTTIKSFCLVLLVGILAGTYSSLFIASPILVIFSKNKQGKK
jgi:preprotein translocase subunit SecF